MLIVFYFIGNSYIMTTTLAGTGYSGFVDGSSGSFNRPQGVFVDTLGNVFVSDYVNSAIRQISSSGSHHFCFIYFFFFLSFFLLFCILVLSLELLFEL